MNLFSRAAIGLAAPLFFGLAASALPATSAEFSPAQTKAIGDIVRDYLVANPEVLRDAMVELDRREKAEQTAARDKVLTDKAGQLFSSPHQAVVGNPNGKITLVEFFDYNCTYCKRSLDDVAKLVKENPDLRVVLKDFPVLGPGSVEAAQVASALRNQFTGDKFWAYHQKLLMSRGPVAKAQALAVAKDMGADMSRLDQDMKSPDVKTGIQETMQIAEGLNLTGTPSWVIGRDVVVGAVGYDELKGKIGNVAKCGKAVCS
ncbi:MAG: DsbA family protein [Beijerinckiaceae bacterium]